MKSNRFWAVLLGALLALSLVGSFWALRGRGGTIAAVYQNGTLLRTIDLAAGEAPYTFSVTGPAGENVIEVERGRVRVRSADCPDQVCVRQGWISTGAVPIVCLPNQLVIQIETGEGGGIDGVSGS